MRVTPEQEKALAALRAKAVARDEAEAEWRSRVRQVDKLLGAAERLGIPMSVLASTANVSRQYLWKRAKGKDAA